MQRKIYVVIPTCKQDVNRHIPYNEVYITTPEHSESIQMNSMLLMIIDHPFLYQL